MPGQERFSVILAKIRQLFLVLFYSLNFAKEVYKTKNVCYNDCGMFERHYTADAYGEAQTLIHTIRTPVKGFSFRGGFFYAER